MGRRGELIPQIPSPGIKDGYILLIHMKGQSPQEEGRQACALHFGMGTSLKLLGYLGKYEQGYFGSLHSYVDRTHGTKSFHVHQCLSLCSLTDFTFLKKNQIM